MVLTEKPSVARDIAAVLGIKQKADGYLYDNKHYVTWAYGHLVGLAEPHQINPAWKVWRAKDLPMLPESWPLEIMPDTAKQFQIVAGLLNAPETSYVISATDAGREGELIFRTIYEKAGCKKPVQRLWISSLTPEAIQAGFQQLKKQSEFDGLADSARARSRADWLVGMNLSRAYSIQTGENFSVGRVQTPTLAMIVARETEIQSFVPEDYLVIQGHFQQLEAINSGSGSGSGSGSSSSYPAYLIEPKPSSSGSKKLDKAKLSKDVAFSRAKRFAADDQEVQKICERVPQAIIKLVKIKEKRTRLPPPQLYDLTELQRHANRLYGFSAEKTLKIAQSLYEQAKLITYPRTDSRYVSEDVGRELSNLASSLVGRYQDELQQEPKWGDLGKRYVDNQQVTDHHAIIPTGKAARKQGLNEDQEKIFDLVCRRLIMAYLPDYQYASTDAELVAESLQPEHGISIKDHFLAQGRRIIEKGWKDLEPKQRLGSDVDKDLPANMREGAEQKLEKIAPIKRRTSPPPRLTDASLLTAMESAGSTLDDKELSRAMRERGLGTPATRSGIIETLIKRQYVLREKQSLRATEKGIRLIHLVQSSVKSPALTGDWEQRLNLMRHGKVSFKEFMESIVTFVQQATQEALQTIPGPGTAPVIPAAAEMLHAEATANDKRQVYQAHELMTLLKERFGFDRFRPHQESVCRDVVKGFDTLLVMPTGAGKSLCYQLPGLALGGCTLVISPLIALMDDQVLKLRENGLRAAAIHSGKSREESRQICLLYAEQKLEFLFIAPERLGVPGFVPFLAKHKPYLIAIDEAHCISQWGHDFRYDYRRLKERLAPLKPTVTIAMTATATKRVQKDIMSQLALDAPKKHIRGFRRTNIAIENVEVSKNQRASAVAKILNLPSRLPAIVYAPTRKEAEQTAQFLSSQRRAAVYHAGMDADSRTRVQEAFQRDELDVIVATTAFGMGIDKANVRTVAHVAVPGSLEGYYQEIGRAGRDGKLSRAVLLYSYADFKTHEYFLRRNYPDVKELQDVYKAIPKQGILRQQIKLPLAPDELDGHLDRLIMIGALQLEHDGQYFPTKKRQWKKEYEEQKQYRQQQLTEMNQYVNQNSTCRMLRLMAHFGDEDAEGDACGICDICAPESSLLKDFSTLNQAEIDLGKKIIERLDVEIRPIALGTLFRDLAEPLGWKRREFDRLLDGLIQQGICHTKQSSFNKSGEIISFRTLGLSVKAKTIAWEEIKIPSIKTDQFSPLTRGQKTRNTKAKSTASRQGAVTEKPIDPRLLERLRSWRKKEAEKRKIPAYRILTDRSLQMIASEKPSNQLKLLNIHGIGQMKVEQFGEAIMGLLEG
ncbi:MAG: DNA topoisomerase 3 [Oligoflexus sp.]